MIEIVYKLYNSALMVDEQIVFACLHRYHPGKYVFENGFLSLKSLLVRPSTAGAMMLHEHSVDINRQSQIQVVEGVTGSIDIAEQIANDEKYLIKQKPAIEQVDLKGEKLENLGASFKFKPDEPMLSEEEVEEEVQEVHDGFFIPGFDDDDADEERNREEKEKRIKRNRSCLFDFQDIQNEFIVSHPMSHR